MRSSFILLGALALAASTGCNSRTTGNEGNFVFSYRADDDARNFNKPIAVGASLDMQVNSVGSGEPPATLSAASTDPAEVMEVTTFNGNELTLKGMADGEVLLTVIGTDQDGEELEDSVNLTVRVPEVLKIWHSCDRDASSAAYLTGSRIFLPFDLEMANGQPVIGYGYYPVTSSDPAAFTVVTASSTQSHIAVDVGNSAASLTLDSEIDSTSLGVTVATPAQIDGVAEPIGFVGEDIDVGDTNSFYVLPKVGADTICQANVTKTVVSDTPEICSVSEIQAEDDSFFEFGWFEVTGVAAGECQYTVSYPEGNAGEGASSQFTTTIEP